MFAIALAVTWAAGLTIRLLLAWTPRTWQITHLIPDDSFYYFQIARNIGDGRGATFDGHTVTNGFHPLWMGMLVPLFHALSADAAIRTALTFSAVLDACTALVVFAIARELTSRRWICLAAMAFYALNPIIALNTTNGLETSLSLFFMMLMAWWCARTMRSDTAPSFGSDCIIPGVAGGLAILARTDNALIFGAILAGVLVRHRLRALPAVLASGLLATTLVAPWVVWSILATGSPVQVSAEAGPFVWHANFEASGHAGAFTLLQHDVHEFVLDAVRLPRLYFGPNLVVAACMIIATACVVASNRARLARSIAPLAPPLAGLLLIFTIDSAIRWHVRSWYFPSLIPFAALILAIGADTSIQQGPPRPAETQRVPGAVVAGVAIVAVLLFAGAWFSALSDRIGWGASYPQQQSMYNVSRGLATSTPPETRLAAFNSGMLGFYSERETVNLDGVVNRDALDAMQRHELASYVQAQGIAYLIDYDSYVSGIFGHFWGQTDGGGVPATSRQEISSTLGDPYTIYAIDGGP